MTAKKLREKTFSDLAALGFRPADSLPLPNVKADVRPREEIAARLMALDALFTWVVYKVKSVASTRLEKYMERNDLRGWLTSDERKIVGLSRKKANEEHADTIGWRLENMWALAWVLGFDPAPGLAASQVGDDVTRPLFVDFLPGLDATIDDLLSKANPRKPKDVIAMEYRFYCAHNAVRSAQLGRDTVPEGFHPIYHGGAVHERRHSLSWCLAPGVSWDDTDLST